MIGDVKGRCNVGLYVLGCEQVFQRPHALSNSRFHAGVQRIEE
jgi:hypothetical protein